MADAFMDKVNSLGERIKVGGAGLSRKMSAGVTSMSGKMKELFQVATPADKVVEEATAETLDGDHPDWVRNLQICDMVNHEQISGQDIVRAIKKRLGAAASFHNANVQLLTLFLLETCVKNCEKMFSEVASERVLDEMVKMIDDPQTVTSVRDKALKLIESWGEATEELRYLPVFEETYKSLRARGIHFPGRDVESLAPIFTPSRSQQSEPVMTIGDEAGFDAPSAWHDTVVFTPEQSKEIFDVARNSMELLSTVLSSSPQQEVLKEELTAALVEQCRQSQHSVQTVIERGESEVLLFEALNINDGIQQVLSKYEQMCSGEPAPVHSIDPSQPALIPTQTVDEDESSTAGSENTLVRKSSARPSTFRSLQGEEDALADLDDMIFGRAGENSGNGAESQREKKSSDLIRF